MHQLTGLTKESRAIRFLVAVTLQSTRGCVGPSVRPLVRLYLFSRVLRDSTPRFVGSSVGPSVHRSIRRSVRHTLLFCYFFLAVFGLTAPAQMME